MVHTKLDLQTWFEKLTAGEIPVIESPPRFYYNDQWAQEEFNDCVDTVMRGEPYNHDIAFHVGYSNAKLIHLGIANLTFSYIPAADDLYSHILLELHLVNGNPCTIETVLPNRDNTDRKTFETKIQWLTHMGCHLTSQWYKDQLLATAWQSMEGTGNE